MGYYQVLKGRYFTHFNPEANNSSFYFYEWQENQKTLGFNICLRDVHSNKLFLLTLSYHILSNYNWEIKYKSSLFGYIKLQETNINVLIDMDYYYIPKANDNIFILEEHENCGDISNHLFSATRYGAPDDYQYRGMMHIHEEQWKIGIE